MWGMIELRVRKNFLVREGVKIHERFTFMNREPTMQRHRKIGCC